MTIGPIKRSRDKALLERDLKLTKDIGALRKQAKAHKSSADNLDVASGWAGKESKTGKQWKTVANAKRQAAKNMRDHADKLQKDLYKARGKK